jgi:hypothetical protein
MDVHYTVHWTNLEVQTISNLPLVSYIKNILQFLYAYFNHSPKRHLELPDCQRSWKLRQQNFAQHQNLMDIYN